jgi:DNA-binding XRE family transcriptional regulator
MSTNIVDTATIAQRLLNARRRAKKRQSSAAAKLGLSRPTFIAIEKGRRKARPGEIIALAGFYGVQVCEIVGSQAQRIEATASPVAVAAEVMRACDRFLSGDMSEGEWSRTLGVDRLSARIVRDQCEAMAAVLVKAIPAAARETP